MARITLYLDEDLAKAVREAADSAGVSRSRWVAHLVRARTAATWPPEFLALEGAWSADSPECQDPTGIDALRESC